MKEHSGKWVVSYVSWKTFRKAVLSGKGKVWDEMMNGDLVMGGMDFTVDFM